MPSQAKARSIDTRANQVRTLGLSALILFSIIWIGTTLMGALLGSA